MVHRSRVHLSSSYKVPLRKDLLAPQEIVRQEAKDSVSPTRPVFDRDLDSEAAELLIVTVPHSNILYIKDYQRRSTHRADCILLLTLLLLRWGRYVLPGEVYRHISEFGCSLVFNRVKFLIAALITVISPSF